MKQRPIEGFGSAQNLKQIGNLGVAALMGLVIALLPGRAGKLRSAGAASER